MKSKKSKLVKINKEPLTDFNFSEEFHTNLGGSLLFYDRTIESHLIRSNGDDYIKLWFDCDDYTKVERPCERDIIYKVEPVNFLDYAEGNISLRELIKKSDDIYLSEYRRNENDKYWSVSFDELDEIYDCIEIGDEAFKHIYDNYYDDTMKPYLINKIRNNKIKSLKL